MVLTSPLRLNLTRGICQKSHKKQSLPGGGVLPLAMSFDQDQSPGPDAEHPR